MLIFIISSFLGWHISFSTDSLILSWQTLAAMVSVSSVIVAAGMAYLRAFFGTQLMKTEANLSRQLRADIKDSMQPVERRLERLEDAGD